MALVPPRNVAEWVQRLSAGARPRDARTVAQVLAWLEEHYQTDDSGKPVPVKWTVRDADRLLFCRYLIETGRLTA